jgi:AcrR family transcriptional regulator
VTKIILCSLFADKRLTGVVGAPGASRYLEGVATARRDIEAPASTSDRYEAIAEAARLCFEQWGVPRTRMDDIAKRAGVPRPALYRYFASKDALVMEVMVRHIRSRAGQLHRKVPLKGPAGPLILKALLTGIVDPPGDRVSETVLGFDVVHDTARLVGESDAVFDAMRDYWRPYLEYARDRGELRDGVDLDQAVRWLTLVVFYILAVPEVAPPRRDLAAYLQTFVVGAVVQHR